jgi:outer membrane receptor protein involved in Fe transport
MEEAMEFIPGVTIIDGQANIRGGSGWSYGAGSRVQLLVDDLPQLTADANDTKWNFLPIENLEQVEVIKGASSVLFGSSALNGVINVRTAYPKATPITKVSFFTGIYDRPVFSIDGKEYDLKWWGDKVLRTSGFSFFHSQQVGNLDLVIGENVFDDQGYREGEKEQRGRFNFNTRYRFKKVEGLSAGVNMNTMAGVSTIFFLFKNDTSGAYTPAPNTLSNSRTYRTNVDPFITYSTKNAGTFRFRSRWFNTTNENNTNQNSKAILFYTELQYQKTIKENLNIIGGLVNTNSTVESQLYGDHTGIQQAGYLQGDLKYKKISVSAGARAERSKLDGVQENWTPVFRGGINFNPVKGTYFRASVGQGYRFPSVAEKFVQTNVGNVVIYPNSDLESEKGVSYEIGVKQLFRLKKWSGYFDVAIFRNEYENMIEFSFAQWGASTAPLIGNGFKSLNIGNTRIDGLDASLFLTGAIGKNWKLNTTASITLLDPRQITYDSDFIDKVGGIAAVMGSDSTDFLKYRSRSMIKGDLGVAYKMFEVGFSIRYSSRMENIDKIFISGLLDFAFQPGLGIGHYRKYHRHGDTIYDLRTSWTISDNVKLSFIVKNLTNYIYMQRPADMQPPRIFIGQVNFTL